MVGNEFLLPSSNRNKNNNTNYNNLHTTFTLTTKYHLTPFLYAVINKKLKLFCFLEKIVVNVRNNTKLK